MLLPPGGLPIARLRLTARVRSATLRLPDYPGSLLRGVIGAAFRRIVCVTRLPACGDCPALRHCAYPAMFEPPRPDALSLRSIANVPVPYVVEAWPPLPRCVEPGECLSFSLVLIGRALARLPLWLMATQRALETGLGRDRVACDLVAVDSVDAEGQRSPLWRPPRLATNVAGSNETPDTPAVLPAHWRAPPLGDAPRDLCLAWLTPLRLQENGRILDQAALDPRRLVAALSRRASLLLEVHGNLDLQLDFDRALAEATGLKHQTDLRRRDWTRYSGRQQREMQMSGQVGRWILHGVSPALQQLLALGELLHVGKGAVFGLGQYRIEPA
jgi:hypothetical protein